VSRRLPCEVQRAIKMPTTTDGPRGEKVGQESQERAGRNEALLRDVNEGIMRGRWPGDEQLLRLRCECERLDCNQVVQLTQREYEYVRENPRRFALAPGHEVTDAEVVVVKHPGYVVVEKRELAGEVAERLEPGGQ